MSRDSRRQREDDVEVRHRQELGFAVGQPSRALPRPGTSGNAGCGRNCRRSRMAARLVLAARDMAAERRRAAALDRAHHLQLVEAHMAGSWPRAKRARGRGRCPRPPELDEPWPPAVTPAAAPASSACMRGMRQRSSGLSIVARSCRSRRGCSAPSSPACRVRAGTRHNAHLSMSLKVKGLLSGIGC